MCKQTEETKQISHFAHLFSDFISRKYFVDLVKRINKHPFTLAMIDLLYFSRAGKILKAVGV